MTLDRLGPPDWSQCEAEVRTLAPCSNQGRARYWRRAGMYAILAVPRARRREAPKAPYRYIRSQEEPMSVPTADAAPPVRLKLSLPASDIKDRTWRFAVNLTEFGR